MNRHFYWLAAAYLLLARGALAARLESPPTTTPIGYVVIIFQENVSFDHYFATYPQALNPAGEPRFDAMAATPAVNGLNPALLQANPNSHPPFRLRRDQALTCGQNHHYTALQRASHSGLMDRFPESTGVGSTALRPCPDYGQGRNLVMAYYDGNTVTALWQYAQHFALSDNFFSTSFGPSTVGHLNLIAGDTRNARPANLSHRVHEGVVIGDPDPAWDDCSSSLAGLISLQDRNIGDLLNAKGVTWGWFQGGFRPSRRRAGTAICGASSRNLSGAEVVDYVPHHAPFQYFRSTANPHHLPPSAVERIGRSDQANHQYDLLDFWQAAQAGRLPSVSFLKAKAAQNGHSGYSNPLDEQSFLVATLNHLQRLPQWSRMAIFIAYDDSDGWYDHVMPPIINQSHDPGHDALTDDNSCGNNPQPHEHDRCGYGPRLPLLLISPWARRNHVDHALLDQTSLLRFIEDNWQLGRIGPGSFDAKAGTVLGMFDFSAPRLERLWLNPDTGLPSSEANNARAKP